MRQKRVGKWIENLLSPSGRNNGLQAHEINKWALRRQMSLKEANGLKGARKERKKANHVQYMM